MLDLDVQVERSLAAVNLLAALVWADERPFDLFRSSSIVLLPIGFLHRGLHRLLELETELGIALVTKFHISRLVRVLLAQLELFEVFRDFTAFVVSRLVLLVLKILIVSCLWFEPCLRFAISTSLRLLLLGRFGTTSRLSSRSFGRRTLEPIEPFILFISLLLSLGDPIQVLVRERKHLGQEIVFIVVLQVVDGIEIFEVL